MNADNIKTITVSFNTNEFEQSWTKDSTLEISAKTYDASYCTNTSEPGLPLIPVNVYISNGYTYQDLQVTQNKVLYKENIVVASAPEIIPTNGSAFFETTKPKYPPTTFPTSSVTYNGVNDFDGHKIVHLFVSPFTYDARTKKLYFSDKFTIKLFLSTSVTATYKSSNKSGILNDIIKSMVINPYDISDNYAKEYSSDDEDYIDYVVITTEALAKGFKPLVDWKTQKGVRAKIITLEYIKETYINKTVPLQIKDCLWDLIRTKGLKYVLLGGDDSIVPVQGCYGRVETSKGSTIDPTIPTDLFYACFSPYNWDVNNNGIYGEIEDNISMTPSLIVTRAPIRTINDAHCFGFKIITYEQEPLICGWENNMLMAGNQFSIKGDAAAKGEKLYEKYIHPYWNGKKVKFYDTWTDFADGADYDFTPSNLQAKLSLGYNFVDIITHGGPPSLSMEKGGLYTTNEVKNLSNHRILSIITTTACETNHFDSTKYYKDDPCLSESFIRSMRTGVIAYLGCSRYGWDYNTFGLGPSPMYNGLFYKNLFSSEIVNKNFGVIVAAAKLNMVNRCDKDGSERWIQYGLNPIGDPEMPIFTETPKKFTNILITQEKSNITINTNVEGCKICVMDADGGNYYKVIDNTNTTTFNNLPKHISVCITKQNYEPKIYKLTIEDTVYFQNETVRGWNRTVEADKVLIGSHVTDSKPTGKVVINAKQMKIKANSITIDSETTLEETSNITITNQKF